MPMSARGGCSSCSRLLEPLKAARGGCSSCSRLLGEAAQAAEGCPNGNESRGPAAYPPPLVQEMRNPYVGVSPPFHLWAHLYGMPCP